MIEEGAYVVRIMLTNTIRFSPIERSTPLTRADAIANGLGTMRDEFWSELEGEGWAIETSAERLSD